MTSAQWHEYGNDPCHCAFCNRETDLSNPLNSLCPTCARKGSPVTKSIEYIRHCTCDYCITESTLEWQRENGGIDEQCGTNCESCRRAMAFGNNDYWDRHASRKGDMTKPRKQYITHCTCDDCIAETTRQWQRKAKSGCGMDSCPGCRQQLLKESDKYYNRHVPTVIEDDINIPTTETVTDTGWEHKPIMVTHTYNVTDDCMSVSELRDLLAKNFESGAMITSLKLTPFSGLEITVITEKDK